MNRSGALNRNVPFHFLKQEGEVVVVSVFDPHLYDSTSGTDKSVLLPFGPLTLSGLMFNTRMGGCG